MTYHRIVLTTGTSIFTGQNAFVPDVQKSGLLKFSGHQVDAGIDAPEEEVLEQWRSWVSQQAFPRADPAKISAECSILHQLRQARMLAPSPVVSLIHSDTLAGEAAALLAQRAIRDRFDASVSLRRASDLGVEDPLRLSRSLGRFMAVVSEELEKGEPSSTCFAPIGGFKVMTALGYVTGCLRGFSMAYVHESNQRLHIIPAIPITMQTGLLEQHREVFLRIHREHLIEVSSLLPREQEILRANPYLFEQTEQEVGFSPFGAFLAARTLRRRIHLGPQAHSHLQRGDTRALVLAELRDLLARLEEPLRHQGVLHHERSWGVHSSPLALFKGASGRAGVFRALYWQDDLGDAHVEHIWTDHKDYEQSAEGLLSKGRGHSFEEVTDLVFRGE